MLFSNRYFSSLFLCVGFQVDQKKIVAFIRCHFIFQEENVPYVFLVKEKEITGSLENALDKENLNTEQVLDIIYQQQAVFRVRPVTRCTRYCNDKLTLI